MKYTGLNNFKHDQKQKVGVLLVNLGTPEQATPKALRKYLKEFLSDTRVVEIPRVIWWMILNLIILPFRAKRSAKAYASIWHKDGSPLLLNTRSLAEKVKENFTTKHLTLETDADSVQAADGDYVIDFAMRYGSPSLDSKVEQLQQIGIQKLLVIPLYPQYSATTTASTFDAIAQSFRRRRLIPELRFVNHYHDNELYIKALADKVKAHWQEHGQAEKLVLSFHGIPKRNWIMGDPYACECHKTSRLLANELSVDPSTIMTTFQSRFGKAEWIKPYTDATLKQLAEDGVKSVQVMCPGFSVDCLETLEEIAEENREYFEESGGESFQYIPCLNNDESHVELMTNIIQQHSKGWVLDNDELNERQARKNKIERDIADL